MLNCIVIMHTVTGYTYVAPGVLLSGPQNVSVNYDLKDQRISVTWEDDPSSSRVPDKLIYDVEVLLTVNMTEVHSVSVCQINYAHYYYGPYYHRTQFQGYYIEV